MARRSIPISLVALCGPAVAAAVAAWLSGPAQVRAVVQRIARWRVRPRWYVIALLAPLPISALAASLEYLAGARGMLHVQPISPLLVAVFVLVAGEEIGWRGFALPILLSRTTPRRASIWVGIMWAAWHLPLFYIPEMPQYGHPFAAFVIYTISLSILLTFLAQRTAASVIIATVFHGAVNTFGIVNAAATPAQRGWGNAAAYGLAAAVVGALAWPRRNTP